MYHPYHLLALTLVAVIPASGYARPSLAATSSTPVTVSGLDEVCGAPQRPAVFDGTSGLLRESTAACPNQPSVEVVPGQPNSRLRRQQQRRLDRLRPAPDASDAGGEPHDAVSSEIASLKRVLALIAARLDALDKRAARLGEIANMDVAIERRQPVVLSRDELRNVQNDLQRLHLGDLRIDNSGVSYRCIANLDLFLSLAQAQYDALKRFHPEDPHIPEVDTLFDSLQQRRRLRPTISAVVRTGVAFTDMANEGDFNIAAGTGEKAGASRSVSSAVLWETAHWGNDVVDVSIRGQLGVGPIPMTYPAADDTSQLRVVQQPGLFYEAHFGFNFVKAKVSEVGIFGGGGQTRPWSREISLTDGSIQSAGRQSAYYADIGVEYRMYGLDSRVAHQDKSLLSPVLRLSGGWRWSERFGRWMNSGWANRPNRRFLRLGVDLRQVFDRRNAETEKQEAFGVRFVAQREWGTATPDVNVVLLEADISLPNLFPGAPTSVD